MTQPALSDDLTIVLAITFGLIVLYQVYYRFPVRKPYLFKIFLELIIVALIVIILSGVFYWRHRALAGLQSGFATWFIALDISLIYAIVIIPVTLEIYQIATLGSYVVMWLGMKLIEFEMLVIVGFMWVIHGNDKDRMDKALKSFPLAPIMPLAIPFMLFVLIRVAVVALLSVWIVWFIFVETTDLQLFLFGAYDGSLGWQYPTSFRLSILSVHIKNLIQTISGDEALSSTIVVIGFIASLIAGAASLIASLADIEEKLIAKNREHSGGGAG